MGSSVFSLDDHYKTQPPQVLEAVKIAPVLEYMIFSGNPVFLEIQKPEGANIKIDDSGFLIDASDGLMTVEIPNLKAKLEVGDQVEMTFGYKRKRAVIKTSITSVEGASVVMSQPDRLILRNLRRNPRLQVIDSGTAPSFIVRIHATTSVGPLEIERAEIHELSQLGMSLFVDRSKGLLLPGDRIESMEISQENVPVFRVSGVVSRVNMKRRSHKIANSYEIVVLFEKRKSEFRLGEVQRSAKRIPVIDSKPCFFSAEHPFFPGRRLEGQVFEISSSGLSCIVERTPFPVVPGMRFKSCQLQLPHRPAREFIFEVAHVEYRSDGQTNEYKMGGEFIKAPVELIKDISSYAQEVSGGLIQDLTPEDFDLLWEFMFETNFIYQNKRKQIQNRSKEILETYRRLISTDNPIVKKMVYKEGEEIKGHISAVRFYDQAWIIQHLNALKANGTSAAQGVLKAIMEFFYDKKANQNGQSFYTISYYRPDNIYPAILFGETCRLINDPQKCSVFDFNFGIPKSEFDLIEDGSWSIDVDSISDFSSLTDTLVSKNLLSFVRAIGLAEAQPKELKVSADYARIGLRRARHLICAKKNDVEVFALCEVSSSGLNLSELTNAIFLFSNRNDSVEVRQGVTLVLQEALKRIYSPLEIAPTVLQLPEMGHSSLVHYSKVYSCWIMNTQAASDYERHSRVILSDLKSFIRRMKVDVGHPLRKSEIS